MIFEYNKKFIDYDHPWSGHRYFARDLVKLFKPDKIVELGTHRGTSMFSFLQGIKDSNINTDFYAIDTWLGDKHTGYYDGNKYLISINEILKLYYPECKVFLIRKTFEDAVNYFKEKEIDILHIDGLHSYEAVRNDFELYFPKVKENGIVLFHDIMEKINDFGVWQLWEQLKADSTYYTIEFQHSHGLGILTKDNLVFKKINTLKNKTELNNFILLHDELLGYCRESQIELNAIYNSKYWKMKEYIKKRILLK